MASAPFSLAGGKAAFATMRGGSRVGGLDDEEDDDTKIRFGEGAITFDQVCFFFSGQTHWTYTYNITSG